MKIVVVDDEPLARQRMRRLLADPTLACEVVAEAQDGVEAIDVCQSHRPDLVLMDIRMPRMDGLQAAMALAQMETPPAVIFVTAYEDHAVQAFETEALDYLLKPVRAERLRQALQKSQRWSGHHAILMGHVLGDAPPPRQHLCAKTSGGLVVIPVAEVRCFVADHKYVEVHTPTGQWLIEDALKDLLVEFGDRFIRVHRNALAALAYIEILQGTSDGLQQLALNGIDLKLSVSRRQLPAVRKRLRQGIER